MGIHRLGDSDVTEPGLDHLGVQVGSDQRLRVYRLPAYTPDINPVEGIWSLLKRSMANFAAADLDGLVRIVKRKPKNSSTGPT